MHNLLSKFSLKAALLVAVALAAVLVIAPRELNKARSEDCQNVPSSPTLNPFFDPSKPFTPGSCQDYPLVRARVVRNGQTVQDFAGTMSELQQGVRAQAGDEILVSLYVHNGANQNLDQSQTDARNVQLRTVVPTSQGSSHMIEAYASASNAASVMGNIMVYTGAGERLEVIPGSGSVYEGQSLRQSGLTVGNETTNLGTIHACYEYVRFVYFKVRVIGQPVVVNPTGQVSAQLGAQLPQCLFSGSVTWSVRNATRGVLTVRDITANGPEQVMSIGDGSTEPINWFQPNHSYRFTVYNEVSGQRTELAQTTFTVPNLNCETPQPQPKDFNFTISATDVCAETGSLTYSISNATSNLYGKEVKWSSTRNGVSTGEVLAGYGHIISNQGTWSGPAGLFRLNEVGNWTKTVTIDGVSKSVSFVVKDCRAPQPNLVCVANVSSVQVNQPVTFTATGGTGSYSWSGTGYPSTGTGSQFVTTYGTTGTKSVTVTSGSQTANCGVTVTEAPPQPTQLVCTPPNQSVNIGQAASFIASGGTGTYSWSATGGVPTTGSSASFSTTYATAGVKTVTVTSGNQNATCYVTVQQQPTTPTLICTPQNQTVQVGQTASFAATGGTGSYSWSATGGSPSTGSSGVFSTSYATAGNKTVTVTSGNQTANCNLTVQQQPTPPQTLTCVPHPSSVDINVPVTFTATGGTGSYSWSGGGNPATGSGSQFVTSFATAGFKYVNVSSGGLTATCPVFVNQPNIPTPGQPALSIVKEVKNLGPSQTTNFQVAINAKKGDTVQYRITVRNNGTGAATNVFVSDSLPSGIASHRNPSVSRSFTGTLAGGLSFSSLAAGETVTITYDGTVNIEQGLIVNTATVSAANSFTHSASATVNVYKDQVPPTTTPGSTIINNNITNNTCVNNSCNNTNIVYIYNNNTVPASEHRQLSIQKLVRNLGGGTFQQSVTVNQNDTVEFEIVVTNTGNQTVNNVRVNDTWNGNMSLVTGTVRIDNSQVSDGNLSNMYLGSLSSGQSKRITFHARVNSASQSSIQNIAQASGDNASTVQDDAWVFLGQVAGGNVNLTYSKRAYNDSKNVDAQSTPAHREDFITYTLTVTNNGNAAAQSFVITDDLSQVLPYADMVDNGGGTVSGNVISFPGITVPAGGSVSKTFRVRVKYHLADNLSYVMTNTYGNTVTVRINNPQVKGAYIAPKTGSNATSAGLFALLATVGFVAVRKRKDLMQLIFA